MKRLPALNSETATGQAQRLLKGVQSKLGFAPNIMRPMANSPAVLQGYLDFSGALSKGELSPKFREQIALTVSEGNDCKYCLAAHSAIGRTVGLSEEAITDTRETTALDFIRHVVFNRGRVADEDVDKLRKAGFADGEIREILANIGLTVGTNYFNHVAGTEVDFPEVLKMEGRI